MYRSPITEENFLTAWEFGCKKYTASRRKACVRRIIVPVSHFLFFLSFLILTYGVLYDGYPGKIRDFLAKIPMAELLWQTISLFLLDNFSSLTGQFLGLALLLYGPAVAAALILFLLTLVFCHPAKPMLSIDPLYQPYDLACLSKQITDYEDDGKRKVITMCGILYTLILLTVCAALLYLTQEFPQSFSMLQNGYLRGTIQGAMYFLIGVLCYLVLELPLKIVIALLSGFRSPRAFHRDAQLYYDESERRKAIKKQASSGEEAC